MQGAVFARDGVPSAVEIGVASATFGLVLGGITGGPVAGWLLRHSHPAPGADAGSEAPPTGFEQPSSVGAPITAPAVVETLALIAVCLWLGKLAAGALAGLPFELPVFVPVLFVGVALRNALSWLTGYEPFDRAVSVVGNVSLALFLAMALMKPPALGTRRPGPAGARHPARPGRAHDRLGGEGHLSSDGAHLRRGGAGGRPVRLRPGGTPTAIANMQAITNRYGPSRVAFVVVPLVGAFFLDLVNAFVIKGLLSVLG